MNDGHMPTVVAEQVVLTLWKRIATQQTAQFFKYGAIWPAAAQLHIVRTALGAEPRGLGAFISEHLRPPAEVRHPRRSCAPKQSAPARYGGDVQDLAAFRQRLKPLRIRSDALAHIVRHASGRETDAEGTQLMPRQTKDAGICFGDSEANRVFRQHHIQDAVYSHVPQVAHAPEIIKNCARVLVLLPHSAIGNIPLFLIFCKIRSIQNQTKNFTYAPLYFIPQPSNSANTIGTAVGVLLPMISFHHSPALVPSPFSLRFGLSGVQTAPPLASREPIRVAYR